jgi:hypothetical protein
VNATNRFVTLALCGALFSPACLAGQGAPPSNDFLPRFVQGFYDWYVPLAAKTRADPVWSVLRLQPGRLTPELLRALRQDSIAKARFRGYVVGLDFDPFLNAQDPCEHYEAGPIAQHGHRFVVQVYGICAGKRHSSPDVLAELERRNGMWVFVNFRYPAVHADLLHLLEQSLHPHRRPVSSGGAA